jgi:hypothetical protein
MSNNLPPINLAQDKQIPLSDKIINWILSVGRLIVIITEIIAIAAFIYRFSLDEKLVDLHSSIKKQQNIVSALKNDEDKFRNIQSRIALASTFSEKGIKTNQTYSDIASLIPSQIVVHSLVLNGDSVSVDADVASISSLSNFVDSLKSYPNAKSTSIDNIENNPSTGLSAKVTILLK